MKKLLENIEIGGFLPFSTVDYPGRLSAVVFTQGCPLRCSYCYNSHLHGVKKGEVRWNDVVDKLTKRQGLLDAVVFSGGEVLLQKGIVEAVLCVKSLGYLIGIHTSGILPDKLAELLKLVDWVGMDIKAAFDDYEKVTNVKDSGIAAKKSASLIIESGVDYEFRTTIHPLLFTVDEICDLAKMLADMGVKNYVLQRARQFQSDSVVDEKFYSLDSYKTIIPLFNSFSIR